MTPEQLAKGGSEAGHQTALFAWAALEAQRYPELRLMFAIPNGGYRTKATAGSLKAQGVKAGVPDIFLPVRRGRWNGLFIELKKEGGKPSADQMVWINELNEQGFGTAVVVGWQAAAEMILNYLNWSK